MAEDSSGHGGGGGGPPSSDLDSSLAAKIAATETLIGELAAEPDSDDSDDEHGGEEGDDDDEDRTWLDNMMKETDEEVEELINGLCVRVKCDEREAEALIDGEMMLFMATVSSKAASLFYICNLCVA